MKRIVILTGAGISAESGIKTFRDSDGLWENHRIEDVATPEAWYRNQELVLEFYNQRRKQLYECKPNAAHYALVELEDKFQVDIITQNVDDLHEQAGSGNVLHLHGELKKARSTIDESIIVDVPGWELKKGMLCPKGSQLRPHIVWFGEAVPNIESATKITSEADIFIVIGTSMNVYPAAGLIHYTPKQCVKFLIDPKEVSGFGHNNITFIQDNATIGVRKVVNQLLRVSV